MIESLPLLNLLLLKKRSEIKVTTCFMSGKLLMFANLSLKSFIYEIADTLKY